MLVGRKTEIEQVYAVVQQERLVTLLGLGGVGKSHLALAVARKALPDFADGVWFVSLTQIEASDSALDCIALAMAAAIGFPLANVQQPLAESAAHLADKKRPLFILDNWDHLDRGRGTTLPANNWWPLKRFTCWQRHGCGSRWKAKPWYC